MEVVAVLTSVSSDNSTFRYLTWKVSQRQSASGLVAAVTAPELWKGVQVRSLFHRIDAGQNWEDYQLRDSGTRNSQNSNLSTRTKTLDLTRDMMLSLLKVASF